MNARRSVPTVTRKRAVWPTAPSSPRRRPVRWNRFPSRDSSGRKQKQARKQKKPCTNLVTSAANRPTDQSIDQSVDRSTGDQSRLTTGASRLSLP